MDFSSDLTSQKIAALIQLRSFLESEVERINRTIQELQWQGIEDEYGEIISYADYSSF